jgi:hypothetical protein
MSYKIIDRLNIALAAVSFCGVYGSDFSRDVVLNILRDEMIFEINLEYCIFILGIQVQSGSGTEMSVLNSRYLVIVFFKNLFFDTSYLLLNRNL